MDWDTITQTGARTPGVERQSPLERWCIGAARTRAQNRDTTLRQRGARRADANCATRLARSRQEGPSDIPALKPYWGKPAVRDFRGSGGNVGIIRSPVRATALPGRELTGP